MTIVIDIPDAEYQRLIAQDGISHTDAEIVVNAFYSGTPLPKGHGNLIQREDAESIFKNARKALYEQSRKERINDFQTRELMLLNAEQFVHLVQPIIKADKELKDEKL